jgi:hypothetical protein
MFTNYPKHVELLELDSYSDAAAWLGDKKVLVLTERLLQEHAYYSFREKYLDAYVSGDLRYDIDIPEVFFTDGMEYLLQSDGKWYVCIYTEYPNLPEREAETLSIIKELYERLEIGKIRKFAYTVIKDFTDIAEIRNEDVYDYPPLDREEIKTWVIDGFMDYDNDNGIYDDDVPEHLIDAMESAKSVREWFDGIENL